MSNKLLYAKHIDSFGPPKPRQAYRECDSCPRTLFRGTKQLASFARLMEGRLMCAACFEERYCP